MAGLPLLREEIVVDQREMAQLAGIQQREMAHLAGIQQRATVAAMTPDQWAAAMTPDQRGTMRDTGTARNFRYHQQTVASVGSCRLRPGRGSPGTAAMPALG